MLKTKRNKWITSIYFTILLCVFLLLFIVDCRKLRLVMPELLSNLYFRFQEIILFVRYTKYSEWIPCFVVCFPGSTAKRALVCHSGAKQIELDRWSNANHISHVNIHPIVFLFQSIEIMECLGECIRHNKKNIIIIHCCCWCRNGDLGDGCNILNWDYSHLGSMSYADAVSYTQSQTHPEQISCSEHPNHSYHYVQEPGSSIVQEVHVKRLFTKKTTNNAQWKSFLLNSFQWDLICEKSFWRTTVATAVSVGKFLGATTFGILSDKFGRRTCFIIGSVFYITGSILTSFSPWYWLFLIGRVFLGSSSSGLFYPAFSLCKLHLDNLSNIVDFIDLILNLFFSDREHWFKASIMDEHCFFHVLSSWNAVTSYFSKFYSYVEKFAIIADHSGIFIGILLLVSDFML